MQQVGGDEEATAFNSLAGNTLRLATNLKALLMTNEEERSFVNEEDMHLELLRKIV